VVVVFRIRNEAWHRRRHDSLTGLYNRLGLLELMHTTMQTETPRALLLLDIDRFKDVNDTLGHTAGDRLLCDVALRLATVAPTGSTLVRLGGDEFAVWLSGGDGGVAAQLGRGIVAALSTPFNVSQRQVSVSGSVGIAGY